MNRLKSIWIMGLHQLSMEFNSKRVWMGFLIGVIVIVKQTLDYISYAGELGEPVNILEAYIIIGNSNNTIMFLALGLLLILSDAPFTNRISFYKIHRLDRAGWNTSMIFYVFIQTVIYNFILILVSILLSAQNGFLANVWSSPLVQLGQNMASELAFKYNLSFPYLEFIKTVPIYKSFLLTLLGNTLYQAILGLILYTLNIFSGRILGVTAVFSIHFLGYQMMREGFMESIRYSLLARAMPAIQVKFETDARLSDTYIIYGAIIILLFYISNKIIYRYDFMAITKEEEE